MAKFSKIKAKPYFGVTFAQMEFFLKPPAMYNCKGPQHLNFKDTE